MFFNIGYKHERGFPVHASVGKFRISLDDGWEHVTHAETTLWFKGYADHKLLTLDHALEIVRDFKNNVLHHGIFCIISASESQIDLITGEVRGFPLYLFETAVTNITNIDIESEYAQTQVSIDNTFKVSKTFLSGQLSDVQENPNEKECFDRLHKYLTESVGTLVQSCRYPAKVFLTGGLDSTLVYSYAAKSMTALEILSDEHFEVNQFTTEYAEILPWGYRQIHHWCSDSVLLSGAGGDPYTLRAPALAIEYCNLKGIDVNSFLYTTNGYNIPKLRKFVESGTTISKTPSCQQLIDIAANDYQHWHFGHTKTLCPLSDPKILEMIIGFPREAVIKQIIDGYISKVLIAMNDPNLLSFITQHKNTNVSKELLQNAIAYATSNIF